MARTFTVVLVPQAEGGFFVECPSLPGCYSQGKTLDEAMANIREAIALALEDMAELAEPVDEYGPPLITQIHVDA